MSVAHSLRKFAHVNFPHCPTAESEILLAEDPPPLYPNPTRLREKTLPLVR